MAPATSVNLATNLDFAKEITLDEHIQHASSHLGRASRNLNDAGEHVAEAGHFGFPLKKFDGIHGWRELERLSIEDFAKAAEAINAHNSGATTHLNQASHALGKADAEHAAAARHLHALNGNAQWANNPKFKAGEHAASETDHHLQMAQTHLQCLARHSLTPVGESSTEEQNRQIMVVHHTQELAKHVAGAQASIGEAKQNLDSSTDKSDPAINPKAETLDDNDGILAKIVALFKDSKEPYGSVSYADPGYQADGKKRYPIDTEAHIRAAWSYINQAKNSGQYSSSQASSIKSKIIAAWKRVIDSGGPDSAKSEQLRGELVFAKDASGNSSDTFEIFLPFTKAEQLPDDTLIVEAWANVSDLIDSDGEYFSEAGLLKFAKTWAQFGNIRGQHDPNWVIGTINNPTVGKLPEGKPLGWEMLTHPETGTKGLFLRFHAIDRRGVQMIAKGALPGLSIGGKVPPGGRTAVDVEVDENNVVLREVA